MTPPPAPTAPDGASPTCNTFAVPVMVDNYGRHQRVVWQPDGPLVPWQVRGAEELWVPIDDTADLLHRFLTEGPQPIQILDTMRDAGHLVVVSGARQAGKTSLLHKAVHSLAQRLDEEMGAGDAGDQDAGRADPEPDRDPEHWTARSPQELGQVKVVPLAGSQNSTEGIGWASGVPVGIDQLHSRILRFVRRRLGMNGGAAGQHPTDDHYTAYQQLSGELIEAGWALLVLLPDFRWKDAELTRQFYRSCQNYARTGIVFFVESSSSECRSDLELEFGDALKDSRVTHLELGPPGQDDWIRFIQARHGAPIPGTQIRVAADVTDGAPDILTRSSVGRLREMLYLATQRAHENRQEEIDAAVLRDVSRRYAPLGVGEFRRGTGRRHQAEESQP